MNKKIIVLLVVALLLNCLVFPVYAAGINVDDITAKRGQEITFYAKLSETMTVKSGAVSVVYDNTSLTLVKAEWNLKETTLQNFDHDNKLGAFAYSKAKSIEGTIFSATFLILDSAELGDTEVEINIKLKNSANEDISIVNRKGTLKILCNHNFSKKDTSDIFLKSAATCTSPAVYYYSCSICGEKGEATYEYGSLLSHTYDKKVATDKYIKLAATCTKKAEYYYSCVCGAMGSEYFETETLPHNYSEIWTKDSNDHWHKCVSCDDVTDVSSHVFEQKYDTTSHWQECSVCGDKQSITAHTFDNACDTSCNACSYTRAITHSYEQKYDTINHWKECSVCGDKQSITAHTFDNACDTSCNDCGYTRTITHSYEQKHDENSHWNECSVCGDKQSITAHIFDNACDTSCNACSYTRAITHSYEQKHDENNHWQECSVCGDKKDTAAHVFDNACDTSCNACSYTRTITHSYEQKHDTANHWKECSVCDKKEEPVAHGFSKRYNDTQHWDECSCGYKKDSAAHDLDGDGKCTQCKFGSTTPGDLDDDNYVGAKDLVLMRRHIAQLEVNINLAAADIDGDGIVGAKDLVRLRRIIAGLAS